MPVIKRKLGDQRQEGQGKHIYGERVKGIMDGERVKGKIKQRDKEEKGRRGEEERHRV